MAIDRYRTMAPELFTINPIKNKVLKLYKIQNKAYGLLSKLFIFTEKSRMSIRAKIIIVSNDAKNDNTELHSAGSGRIKGLEMASHNKINKLPKLCGIEATLNV